MVHSSIAGAGSGACSRIWSRRRSSRARQASRSPPSAYRIRRVARRPGGPYRLRATSASVRWPTMSRPSRIHDRRASSRRRLVASATAVASPPASPGGSSTTKSVSERRASAASRPSRSAIRAGRVRGGQPATRQVQDEQVDRAPGQQRATDGEALVEGFGGDDDQPFETDTAGDGLDRVEAARQVEPGDDGSGVLCLRREPQHERRPAARAVTADRDTGGSGQAARSQDGVERREAGMDDAVVRVGARLVPWPDIGECRGRPVPAPGPASR